MKKILDIICIPEASDCYSLEAEFKIQRKNIKRYQESLIFFKDRIVANSSQIKGFYKSLHSLHQIQSKPRKKISEIQYYVFNGTKVFGAMVTLFSKSSQFYDNILKKILSVDQKIRKCILTQKKKYLSNSELHQKEIKSFATQCYPQTSSFLFTIGFVSANKITKKVDSFRQMSVIEQSKRYSTFLKQCLDQMQEIKKECLDISSQFYEAAKNMWLDEVDAFRQTIQTFEVNQQEIDNIATETGLIKTDRSSRSNLSHSGDQDQTIT